MKINEKKSKLGVRRETLRKLSEAELSQAAGGSTPLCTAAMIVGAVGFAYALYKAG
jgi:hypothetical protein